MLLESEKGNVPEAAVLAGARVKGSKLPRRGKTIGQRAA
jgi:hypothetical protein